MTEFMAARRLVIKVGTSNLTYESGHINIRRIELLCKTLADLKNSGREIVFVTSGAISAGMGRLHMDKRPTDTPSKQAAAAVGQCELMALYDKLFLDYGHTVAQLLLIKEDVDHPVRRTNMVNTLSRLLELRVIPIINENDTVAVDEIVFGDNDTLSAVVAEIANADCLILLSDIDGLYSADPRRQEDAARIELVTHITPEIEELAGGAGSARGTGGMATKIHAAKICERAGINMAIINGNDPTILYALLDGEPVGTRFIWEKSYE